MKLNISLPRPLMPLALLFALLFFAVNLSAAPLHLGSDISFHYYEDREGDLTFEQFRQLPLSDLTETDHIRSFGYTNSAFWVRFSLPETLFLGGDRWLKLGPNFLDRLTLYYREAGPHNIWTKHEAGDLSTTPRGEIDYRFPVFILPALKTSASRQEGGYEVIIRIESTSAVMLNASLWQPAEFSQHATSDSSFWSFYFGLAFISSALALILAVLLRHRLLWTIFLFSLTSVLVACVEGYIAWIWGDIGLRLQHYLTSTLTLLAYTSLLWMCTEAINIKKYLPRTNKFIMLMVIGNLLLQTSIPFDFYGLAIKVQGIILITSALI
ncbi:MAG: 7TM-DISM domain-containing protein, partial [Marinobacterium sp.]